MTNKEKYLQRIAGKKSNALIEAEWRIKNKELLAQYDELDTKVFIARKELEESLTKTVNTNEIKNTLMKSLYDAKSLITDNFVGCGLGECDVLRITGADIVYEYEVKVSRADFKAEMRNKTKKHEVLRGKHKTNPHTWNYPGGGTDTEEILQERWGSVGRPNFFYFVSPENLLNVDEIPDFAGLIYISESEVKVIKKAPKLHSFKATDKLIRKVCNALSAKSIFGSDIKLE